MTEVRVAARGRPPVTSAADLEHLALRIFTERGFDETTVDDLARAAGIGRRTFFRYFPSKNDLPWGDFDTHLDRMRVALASSPRDESPLTVLRREIVAFNSFPADEADWHRQRMALILHTPTLTAHSTLRYARWREVVAEFVAVRLGVATSALVPQAVGWACLGVALAAYEQWLSDPSALLVDTLDEALRLLINAFDLD